MQKNSKTIFTAVVTALFVLSVSYFALLAPTTAWFYQEDATTAHYEFTFADFDMSQEEHEQNVVTTVPLRAATRFADSDEKLFDEVAHVVKVDAQNDGGVKSQVLVDVHPPQGASALPSWLHWCVLSTPQNTAQVTTNEIADPSSASSIAQTKGGYKQAIESMLTSRNVTPAAYSSFASDAAYETYNTTAKAALSANNAQPIVFDPNDAKVVYVVFWAEYGQVASTNTAGQGQTEVLFKDATNAVTLGNCSVQIDFKASPYIPENQPISVTNTTAGTVTARLYLNGNTSPYMTTPADTSTGIITIAAGTTVTIQQPVGTAFKLTIANITIPTGETYTSVHYANVTGGIGTVAGDGINSIVTDTVSSRGNAYNIVVTQSQS